MPDITISRDQRQMQYIENEHHHRIIEGLIEAGLYLTHEHTEKALSAVFWSLDRAHSDLKDNLYKGAVA